MEKSAWNRLTLPNLPENNNSWTLYPRGWNRVHTALQISPDLSRSPTPHNSLHEQLAPKQSTLGVLVVEVVWSSNIDRIDVLSVTQYCSLLCAVSATYLGVVDFFVRSITLYFIHDAIGDTPAVWRLERFQLLDELVGGFRRP